MEKLAALVDEMAVVHVRGTPSSGKTTLAELLRCYYQEREQPAVLLTGWPLNTNLKWQEHLILQCRAARFPGINSRNFWSSNVVFILDEGQISYHDETFWLEFVKTLSGNMFQGPRLCLFASYGSPTTGPLDYPRGATPVHLGPNRRISIIKPSDPDSHGIGLYYDETEFNDAVDRFCSAIGRLVIDEEARSLLYWTTNGHPGAVQALANCLYDVCR